MSAIAQAQSISSRFLGPILTELCTGGFVESKRGKTGGFRLARPPETISLAEVILFVDGELFNLVCNRKQSRNCKLKGHCVFAAVWLEAMAAIERVYHEKTLQDLLSAHNRKEYFLGA